MSGSGDRGGGAGASARPGSARLDARERRSYQDDGFFVRAASFSAPEVEALRAAAERAGARAAAAAPGAPSYHIDGNRYAEAEHTTIQFEHYEGARTLRVLEPFHHLDPVLDALIDDLRLVEPMRDLVGSERISLFTDKLNFKRPREGSRFRWHQDSPYWAFEDAPLDHLPNVMVALDDASEENGCLCFIRGSHRRGMLPGTHEGTLGPLFTDARYVDLERAVAAEVPAGSLVFFSPHTVHGSEPNRSDRPRRALVLTYQPGVRRMFKVDACREAGAPPGQRAEDPADADGR